MPTTAVELCNIFLDQVPLRRHILNYSFIRPSLWVHFTAAVVDVDAIAVVVLCFKDSDSVLAHSFLTHDCTSKIELEASPSFMTRWLTSALLSITMVTKCAANLSVTC